MADPIADDFAAIARRAREISGGPTATTIGEDEGETCGRNGCCGVIEYGLAAIVPTPNGPSEQQGLRCTECEWTEYSDHG